jgi:toxin YoeB
MEIELSVKAKNDLNYWKKSNNTKVLKRIKDLLASMQETPFHGIGKPEPLKHNLSGYWSRRIDNENRIIYEIENNTIFVDSLRGHY